MAHNLLEVVQRVLEKLNLEDINSINDSSEALLIAREAENTYYDLLSRDYWPYNKSLIELESVGSSSTPNVLKVSTSVAKIEEIRYDISSSGDTSKTIQAIKYMEPSDFLDYLYLRNTDEDNIDEITWQNTPLFVINDQAPTYWTTFDDEYLIFDSYDSEVETTLNGNKSACIGYTIPSWTMVDTFTIDIPEKWWSLYLAEVSSSCSVYLNQEPSPVDVQRISRGISRMRREANILVKKDLKSYFGRLGNGVS